MTIFSLGNACDLVQFTNNTKLDSLGDVDRPVVPMPADPPSFGILSISGRVRVK